MHCIDWEGWRSLLIHRPDVATQGLLLLFRLLLTVNRLCILLVHNELTGLFLHLPSLLGHDGVRGQASADLRYLAKSSFDLLHPVLVNIAICRHFKPLKLAYILATTHQNEALVDVRVFPHVGQGESFALEHVREAAGTAELLH